MKKLLMILGIILMCSGCSFNLPESGFETFGKTMSKFDNATVWLENGWFIDDDSIIINYTGSTITMKIYQKQPKNVKVIK